MNEGEAVVTTVGPPPRGTRPANRRELLRQAATDLFSRHGYANVAMSDVAAAVNVGPSAVYRHYPGKAELLFDAIDVALEQTLASLPPSGTAPLPEIARILANQTLDNRPTGVLWQREVRNLSPDAAAAIRRKRAQISGWLTGEIALRRPELTLEQAELLGVCASDAMTSVSFHRLELPREQLLDLLVDLTMRVILMDPSADTTKEPKSRRPKPTTRPDEILDRALTLFAERGYTEVSIDDIGASVGIAGPSVYNHFPSKLAILVEAMVRGYNALLGSMQSGRVEGSNPADVLRRVSDSYVDQTFDHPDLIGVLITESVHLLGPGGSAEIREAQRSYIQDWVSLAVAHHGDDPTVARIKVQAAQMMINDVARTARLLRIPGLRATVREAAWLLQQ
jgi:AcrR family transcriptional regulator